MKQNQTVEPSDALLDEAMPDSPSVEETEEEKIRADITLLRSLFPALSAEEIPDEVWEKVSEGQSLAASYALSFLIDLKEKERIEEKNRENEKKSIGRIKQTDTGEDYFSPEAVRAMSPSEVRKHYAAILKSMDSWN